VPSAGVCAALRFAEATSDAGSDPIERRRYRPGPESVLGDSGITSIFATSLRRSQEIPASGRRSRLAANRPDDPAVIGTIGTLDSSTTVFIVGHTDDVPHLVVQLGGPTITPLAANAFNRSSPGLGAASGTDRTRFVVPWRCPRPVAFGDLPHPGPVRHDRADSPGGRL
jgi:hypothetical protein